MAGDTDAAARRNAIDTSQSFIVRAPAGSGKTTVLVQRVLALLAKASRPEEIVALTFTRKAAAEMRDRVITAIERAANGESVQEEPGQTTTRLAAQALQQDERMGWNLLRNPDRLVLETIDAFNARLASHLALESSAAGEFSLLDDARPLYRQAVTRLLNEWGSEPLLSAELDRLMLGLGNNLDLAEKGLVGLLSRREQWLGLLRPGLDDPEFHAELERSFVEVSQGLQSEVYRRLPKALGDSLFEVPASTGSAGAVPSWSDVAKFWLTDKGEWRKRFDRNVGVVTAEDRALARDVVSRLAQAQGLAEALSLARHSDAPAIGPDDGELLSALRSLLIRLAGHLEVVLSETGRADFTALARAALSALGSLNTPTELLLALDYRIGHILVDEFQDTSQDQFNLLVKLTSGWMPDDGRTLFLVGDPMQSIYGFRNAEVGLFLHAWEHGLPEVRLQQLTLERNFRSEPALVEWVNDRFGLSASSDLVNFVPCEAARADQGGRVEAFRVDTAAEEVQSVVALTQRELERNANQSIGILVRSRSHQTGLLRALAAAGIAGHGVEIDSLNERQTVQDLIGLSRALVNLADDIAWLGCLRAPWCGLTLASLEKVTAAADSLPLGVLLMSQTHIPLGSAQDEARLARLRDVTRRAMPWRAERGTSAWIEQTWRALGGEHACATVVERQDAEQYFERLDRIAQDAPDFDPLALDQILAEPLGGSDAASESGIEVMTIHKAKGLEFDTVILMGSGRSRSGSRERELLHFKRLHRGPGNAGSLVAPVVEPGKPHSRAAQLCRALSARDSAAEEVRLLYVGLTRARHRLYLPISSKSARPPRSSLIAPIWEGLNVGEPPSLTPDSSEPSNQQALLERIPLTVFDALPRPPDEPEHDLIQHDRFDQQAAAVGTVFHRLAEHAVGRVSDGSATKHDRELRRELARLGLGGDELEQARETVLECFGSMLKDPRGRWLLEDHERGASELALVMLEDGEARSYAVDRTFLAEGVCWIVDYKTSALPKGVNVDTYLHGQRTTYLDQLRGYGRALAQFTAEPIRLALYYPQFGGWIDWPLEDES